MEQNNKDETCGYCIVGFITSFVFVIIPIFISLKGLQICKEEGLKGRELGIAGLTIAGIKAAILILCHLLFLMMKASISQGH